MDPTFWHEHLHSVWEQSDDYEAPTQLTCDNGLLQGRFGLNHETISEDNNLTLAAATFVRNPTGPATKRVMCEYALCLSFTFPPADRGFLNGVSAEPLDCSEPRVLLNNLQ